MVQAITECIKTKCEVVTLSGLDVGFVMDKNSLKSSVCSYIVFCMLFFILRLCICLRETNLPCYSKCKNFSCPKSLTHKYFRPSPVVFNSFKIHDCWCWLQLHSLSLMKSATQRAQQMFLALLHCELSGFFFLHFQESRPNFSKVVMIQPAIRRLK